MPLDPMRFRTPAAPPTLVALIVLGATMTSAQPSPVPFPAGAPSLIEFSLSNPGARSLGLGGAFVALADDATAAFANPAGLVQLVRPEVSLEFRHWTYETSFIASGRLAGAPTGIGLDTEAGTRFDASKEDVDTLSFASVVLPRDRWSVALYYHRQLDYRYEARTEGLFGLDGTPPFAPRRPDYHSVTQARISTFGSSVGVRLGEHWSVGLGIVWFENTIDTLTNFYVPIPPTPDNIFGPLSFAEHERVLTTHIPSEDTDWGFNLGLLWQPSPSWSFGASYREGAGFDHTVEVRSGPAIPGLPPDTTLYFEEVTPLELPYVYGFGGAWRSQNGAWTVSAEWDHVNYSSIIDSFERDLGDVGAELDNADELHFGLELALLDRSPVLAIRAGAWLDPDHRIRGRSGPSEDEYLQAIFRPGDDAWHASLGLGVALERLQIDLAADMADEIATYALSAIWTF